MTFTRPALPLILLCLAANACAAPDIYLRIEAGGHTADVRKLAFSPDGETLYSVGSDKTVRVWNTVTGRQIKAFHLQIGPGAAGDLDALAVDPRGRWIAVGGTDSVRPASSRIRETSESAQTAHSIKIIDVKTGEVAAVLGGAGSSPNKAPVSCLAFAPDGTQLAAGDLLTGAIKIWHVGDWKVRAVKKHANYVTSVSFSHDGSMIASSGADGRLIYWNAASGQNSWAQQFGGPIYGATISPDGNLVAAGSADKSFKVYDSALGRVTASGTLPSGATAVAFARDSKSLFVSGGDTDASQAKVWQYSVADSRLLGTWADHRATVFCLATSPQANVYASGGVAGELYLRSLDQGRVATLCGVGEPKGDVQWASDGGAVSWSNGASKRLAFDLKRASVGVADGRTWSKPAVGSPAQDIEIGGSKFAVTGDGRSIVLFQSGSEKGRYRLAGDVPEEMIQSYAAFLDGRVVAATQYAIYLFGPDFKQSATLIGYEGLVQSMQLSPDGKWLAAATTDQAVRLWPLDAKPAPIDFFGDAVQPSLQIFTTRTGEWVAWTPQGYYAASAAGDAFVGWHKNRGIGKAADFYGAFQFRQRFYRPDITSRVYEAGGDVGQAAQAATAATGIAAEAQPKVDADPPTLAIESVTPGELQSDGTWKTTAAHVQIKVRVANPGTGGVRLRLRVDGHAKDLVETASTVSENTVEADLQPGTNTISILGEANNGVWSTNSDAVSVQLTDTSSSAKTNLHVLAIGISAQRDSRIPALQFADNDATALCEAFAAQKGRAFASVTTKSLTNEQATGSAVRQALQELSSQVQAGDEVVVLISGHGDLIGGKGEPFRAVFAPYDANRDDLKGTCIRWGEMMEVFDKLPCRNVVLLADTCRSGAIDVERLGGYDASSVFARESADPLHGIVSVTSSDIGQLSWEFSELKHGVFTYGLLESIRNIRPGAALSIRQLFTAVSLYVPPYVNGKIGKLQQPRMLPPFSIVAAGQTQLERFYDSIILGRG